MHILNLRNFITIHYTHLNKLELGKRKPSLKLSIVFERVSGITKIAWLFPEEIFNPYLPHLYQGSYPPDLSHLSGEPLKWAQEILKAFPDRPPTLAEWRSFRKHLYKKNKTDNKKEQRNEDKQIDKTSTKLASL